MASEKFLSLAEFEWASVARYIVYISTYMGLSEINSNHVISFPLGRLGPDKLLKQKERVLAALDGNRTRIERFVGEHRESLEKAEMSVLRGLYLQYKGNGEVVKSHIEAIGACMVAVELYRIEGEEVGEDDSLY